MPTRRAFTLVELLAVVAIIAVLVGLLVPAVQRVREAGSRLRCAHHLKQLALACHAYHDAERRLPPGGRVHNNRDYDGEYNQGSWLLRTLPYMEQSALYAVFAPYLGPDDPPGVDRPLSVEWAQFPPAGPAAIPGTNNWDALVLAVQAPAYLRCPSDAAPPTGCRGRPVINYAGSGGPVHIRPVECNPYPGDNEYAAFSRLPGIPQTGDVYGLRTENVVGCFNWGGAKVAFVDITDGTSGTILLGEMLPRQSIAMSEYFAWWSWGTSAGGWNSTNVPINYRTDVGCVDGNDLRRCDELSSVDEVRRSYGNDHLAAGFKSRHPGGVNFAFADGSVRFVAQTIDHELYQYLGCRNDGTPYGDPDQAYP